MMGGAKLLYFILFLYHFVLYIICSGRVAGIGMMEEAKSAVCVLARWGRRLGGTIMMARCSILNKHFFQMCPFPLYSCHQPKKEKTLVHWAIVQLLQLCVKTCSCGGLISVPGFLILQSALFTLCAQRSWWWSSLSVLRGSSTAPPHPLLLLLHQKEMAANTKYLSTPPRPKVTLWALAPPLRIQAMTAN